jgi:replicative superfamily II helicase
MVGIAINSIAFGEEYNAILYSLACKKRFPFIVSDDSICYGINLPLNTVIIEDNLINKRSFNTILQLMGRAGRVG